MELPHLADLTKPPEFDGLFFCGWVTIVGSTRWGKVGQNERERWNEGGVREIDVWDWITEKMVIIANQASVLVEVVLQHYLPAKQFVVNWLQILYSILFRFLKQFSVLVLQVDHSNNITAKMKFYEENSTCFWVRNYWITVLFIISHIFIYLSNVMFSSSTKCNRCGWTFPHMILKKKKIRKLHHWPIGLVRCILASL